MGSSKTKYFVYVIELSKSVWNESAKFRDANPQYNGVLECLYVGMTSKDPKKRFAEHKRLLKSLKGHYLSASIVYKYGLYLRPSLYHHHNPMTKSEALSMESTLGKELRRKRYAVWWN